MNSFIFLQFTTVYTQITMVYSPVYRTVYRFTYGLQDSTSCRMIGGAVYRNRYHFGSSCLQQLLLLSKRAEKTKCLQRIPARRMVKSLNNGRNLTSDDWFACLFPVPLSCNVAMTINMVQEKIAQAPTLLSGGEGGWAGQRQCGIV